MTGGGVTGGGVTGDGPNPGRLVAVVGPSGAGKDTLLEAARAARPDLILARRVITRAAGAGGENHEPATPADFARRRNAGEFFLCWEAHGLSYGVPARYLDDVRQGRTVLFNGSRHALGPARHAVPDLRVILVSAPPGLLAARLASRGREAAEDIERRVGRSAFALPEGIAFREVANDGPLDRGVARFLAALQPVRA